ncbi:MAG TPA: hypothetical protein VNV38_17485 [Stellaceae bacterium]|jgi:hypothetical protein|nr:hypothetical protein [Stellaceae bacterium]
MSEILDTSQFELPAGVLVDLVDFGDASNDRNSLLMQILERVEKSHAAQVEWARQFESLYDEAARGDYPAPFLVRWAGGLIEKQRAASEQIYPLLEQLQRMLAAFEARSDPEMAALCVAVFSVTLSWMTPYQTLSGKLLELASARQPGTDKVLRAKPVKGEVDHEALSREFMARFPKLRAALAK